LYRSDSSSIRRSTRERERRREEKCSTGNKRRHEEEEEKKETLRQKTRKKDEWLYGGCALLNELINNQSGRWAKHNFDPPFFDIDRKNEEAV
jgi:hypothetical protein